MDYCLILLRLIRFKNLIIITAIQVISLHIFCQVPQICAPSLSLAVILMSVLVSAGGYIINDLFDVDIDRINKPLSRVVEKMLTKQHVILLYTIVLIAGLLLAIHLDLRLHKNFWVILYLILAVVCFSYSRWFKKSFLLGNLIVAGMSGFVSVIVLFPFLTDTFQWDELPKPIIFLTLFSVIVTFYREIVKDIEDLEGDQAMQASTIPIILGVQRTKKLLILLNILILALIFPYFDWNPNAVTSVAHSITLTALLLLYSLILRKIIQATVKQDYHNVSVLLKMSMLVGLVSAALAS